MAAGDLITLAQYKAWQGITTTTKDSQISAMISAASAMIVDYCDGTLFTYATLITEVRDGNDADRMVLLKAPVDAVATITINDVPVLAAPDTRTAGFRFGDNTAYLTGYRFSRGRRNVVICYSAGYTTVPAVVQQAALVATQGLLSSAGIDPNVASEAIPGVWSGSYTQANASTALAIPAAAAAMLNGGGFRRTIWGGWP